MLNEQLLNFDSNDVITDWQLGVKMVLVLM